MVDKKPAIATPAFPMPDIIHKRGDHEGYPWVVTKNPEFEAYNGYVCVPKDHPWMKVDDAFSITTNVPFGDITYNEGHWFGFDTMHSGQHWPEIVDYYNRIKPGLGESFKMAALFGQSSLEMTEGHVLTWVIQLCIDARDAYNDKEKSSGTR